MNQPIQVVKSRLAPTPSGYLHMGNAINFIWTAYLVRKAQGVLMLRIDDLDSQRIRPAYIEDIFRSLEWLGIEWEEGPNGPDEFAATFSQHHRMDLYQEALNYLSQKGGVLFGCQLSRKEIKAQSQDGHYPIEGRSQQVPLDGPDTSWRFLTKKGAPISFKDHFMGTISIDLFQEMRDFVIKRKDGLPAYQLSSLIDDLHFGINTIVRGEDLLHSTAAQLSIAEQLKKTGFEKTKFYHHPLLMNQSGQKLSKSEGSSSLKAMRETGTPASAVYHTFCRQHQLPLVESLDELISHPQE